MKHLIASLLCIAMLAGLTVLFGFIMAGQYERLVYGESLDWAGIQEMLGPKHYRKLLIPAVVALVFALLDIQSLLSHGEASQSAEPKPRYQPLGFAALRARRYFLLAFVIVYAALAIRLLDLRPKRETFTLSCIYAFTALFGLSRRPLNWSVDQVFSWISDQISDFLSGLAKGS